MADSKNDNGKSARSIYCVNCLHCKEFTQVSPLTGIRERRIRCAAGQWATPAGREKTHALNTALDKRLKQCAHYDSMGEEDLPEFLKMLRRILPAERIFEKPSRAPRKCA